jgi:hypothetical protein
MFFPGMDVQVPEKRRIVREVLGTLVQHFTLVPMSTHAAEALAQERLAVREPQARRLEAAGEAQ